MSFVNWLMIPFFNILPHTFYRAFSIQCFISLWDIVSYVLKVQIVSCKMRHKTLCDLSRFISLDLGSTIQCYFFINFYLNQWLFQIFHKRNALVSFQWSSFIALVAVVVGPLQISPQIFRQAANWSNWLVCVGLSLWISSQGQCFMHSS